MPTSRTYRHEIVRCDVSHRRATAAALSTRHVHEQDHGKQPHRSKYYVDEDGGECDATGTQQTIRTRSDHEHGNRIMTLVHEERNEDGAELHALVIGVGEYPWLEGGASPSSRAVTDGMGQLDSPPISAKAFCDWLIVEYAHGNRRLATVDLLLSEPGGGTYSRPQVDGTRGEPFGIEQADIATIREAARVWKARGRASPDDMLIFFFCGHGVSAGFKYALLASDFARDEESAWDGAFSLDGLAEYMRDSTASRQVFFVDACRVASANLLSMHATRLDTLVGVRLPLNVEVEQSIYYSALGGQAAYGRLDDVSLFTSALLKGLRGHGASDNDGYWAIDTTVLHRAISSQLSELADPVNGLVQTPQTGYQSAFEIARLPAIPVVPLYIKPSWHEGDDPPDEIATVSIHRADETLVEWRTPWNAQLDCSWKPNRFQSDLEAGEMYSCSVRFDDGQTVTTPRRPLMPPYRIVEISKNGDA